MKIWNIALSLMFIAVASRTYAMPDEIHWTFSNQDSVPSTWTGATSITFNWRGAALGNQVCYQRTSPSPEVGYMCIPGHNPTPLPTSSGPPDYHWEAKIPDPSIAGSELWENAAYQYYITDSNGLADIGTFHTPPCRPENVSAPCSGTAGVDDFVLYVVGDIGSHLTYSRVLPVMNIIADWRWNFYTNHFYEQPDFALIIGDLTYADNHTAADVDAHFNDAMLWSRDAAYMPAWGNHEWSTDPTQPDNLNNYEGRFDLPHSQTSPGANAAIGNGPKEDWSWFVYGHILFISYPEPYNGALADWGTRADSLMAQAEADPSISAIVTFGHRPAYSASGSASGTLQGILDDFSCRYTKYLVNLAGHAHHYERTDLKPDPAPGSCVPHATHLLVGTGHSSPSTTVYGGVIYGTDQSGVLQLHITSCSIDGQFICGPLQSTACPDSNTVKDSFSIPIACSGDSIPPHNVAITAPSNGASVSGTVTVSATASDNIGVTEVDFRVDGVMIGTDSTSPYSIAWNTDGLSGSHTLTAIARDAANNATTSSPVSVTVNNSLTFAPEADATIKSASPGTNYGSTNTLTVDKNPAVQFLIKFNVSALAGQTVTGAKLRLYNVDSSGSGGSFFRVADNSWSETDVNWNNAPQPDPTAIASLGAVSAGTWYEVVLPQSLITDALSTAERVFSLRVQSTVNNNAVYSAKENTSGFAPQLVVDVQ